MEVMRYYLFYNFILMIWDLLKVFLWIFMWFVIWFASLSASYRVMQQNYFDCQIKYSWKIEFQSGFAEWLLDN